MSKLYGDVYSAGMSSRSNRAGKQKNDGTSYFRHKVKPFKLGVIVKNQEKIDNKMKEIFKKYAIEKETKLIVKEDA